MVSRPTGGGGASKSVGGMSAAGMSSSVTQHTTVDPTEAEEEVMKGRITFALTAHKEVSRVPVGLDWVGLDVCACVCIFFSFFFVVHSSRL